MSVASRTDIEETAKNAKLAKRRQGNEHFVFGDLGASATLALHFRPATMDDG
jgi:hypothetical protein